MENKNISAGSVRKWRNAVILFLIISLIPIIVISFYNHSSADDYSYGIITRHAWMQSHSIIDLIKGVGRQVCKSYMTWQGTYAAVAVFSLQPGVFSDKLYFMTTLILVGILILCTFYFFRTVLAQFGADCDVSDITAGVVSILSIQTLPHAIQSFFWWNGSTFYTFFYSLMLLQIAIMVSLFLENHHAKRDRYIKQYNGAESKLVRCHVSESHHIIKWICCILLGFIISGGNFISALVNLEITVLFLLICIIRKRNIIGSLLLTAVTGAGFAISVMAPGNAVRMATETQISPLQTILQSFQYGFQYVQEYMNLYLIIAMVFLLPFLWRLCDCDSSSNNNCSGYGKPGKLEWLFMLIVMFCLFSSSFAPTVFTSEQEGPRRIQNIRYFMFIVMSILMETGAVYVVKYILSGAGYKDDRFENRQSILSNDEVDAAHNLGLLAAPKEQSQHEATNDNIVKADKNSEYNPEIPEEMNECVLDVWHGISQKTELNNDIGFIFRRCRKRFFAAILICLLIVTANDIIPRDRRDNLTSVSTARSLLIGEAQGFDKVADERLEIYLSDEKDITLPQYIDHPKALYYADFDVTGDVTDWKNVAAARFYDKDSVGLE